MKNLTLLIAFLITININAQWTSDTDVNTLVAESVSDDMQAIGTSDGQTYVVFWKSVAAPTNYELRLQVLDVAGYKQLGDDGILISDNISMSTFTVAWSIAVDSDNNIIIGATGTGDDSGRLFKLDSGGNHLWNADGIIITGIAYNVTLLPLESGETVVSWIAGTQTEMQKYDASGNAVWASTQTITSGTSKTAPANMFELSNGDYISIFHTYAWGVNSTLYAQRYNDQGVAQWTSPTELSNTTTTYNKKYSATQDGDIIYIGYMGAQGNRFDSYLQRINPDGTIPWGINGMDFDVNQTNYETYTKIALSAESQFVWSICTYADVNQTIHGEWVQKFDKETGARQLSDNAKMVYELSGDDKIHASDLHLVDDQPFFILQSGMNNGASPIDLGVLLLDSNGDFVWPEEVKTVASYEANKTDVHLTETVNGQAVAIFAENKSNGLKIYAQNFSQGASLPDQPVLVTPENGATDLTLSTTFTWNAAQGAESYSFQIAEDNAFTTLISDETGITGTNFSFELPDYETTYFWRVMASNTTGDSDWSETWNFTTITFSIDQPLLLSPANGATNIPLEAAFTWENTLGADTYNLQIANDNAFTNIIADETGITATNFDFDLSDFETTYFWRVMASNASGDSEWSVIWSFTTLMDTPNQPVLVSPEDGITGIQLENTFTWEDALGADSYSLQISENDAFSTLVADETGLTATNFDFDLPDYETTYFWRVMASNTSGDSEWSEVWSFTTLMDTPDQPILVSPEDGATGIQLENTFTWEDALGAETYNIQIAEDNTFTTLVADETGILITSFDFDILDYFTTYYWRVMAGNTAGNSEWSETWSFTTVLNIGTEDLNSKVNVNIYPNPTKDYLHIDIDQSVKGAIYNLAGNMIKSMDLNNDKRQILITDLPNGIYLLKLYNEAGELISSKKVIKN